MIIPSFAGVRLQVQLKDREIRAPWDALCRRNSDGWRPAWLPDKSDVGPLNAPCTVENIAFNTPTSSEDPAYAPPRTESPHPSHSTHPTHAHYSRARFTDITNGRP